MITAVGNGVSPLRADQEVAIMQDLNRRTVFSFFPRWPRPPDWVWELTEIFARSEQAIEHECHLSLQRSGRFSSDQVLAIVRPALLDMGFLVEGTVSDEPIIRRPVFFGRDGRYELQYQIDAYHPELKIGLEVERGRAWQGNAFYRDIIQMSLIVDMDYAAVAVPIEYRYRGSVNRAFEECEKVLNAIYGGQRLRLPFEGFLLIGY